MKLASGYRLRSNQKMRPIKGRPAIGLNQDSVLIIKLPCSRILGVISKSLFLAVFILVLPLIGSYVNQNVTNHDEFLPMVFKDLMNEGVITDGQKGVVLSSGIGDLFDSFWFLNNMGIDVVTGSDLVRKMVMDDEVFDFVFVSSLENGEFINKIVKIDGIVVMPLGNYCDRCYEFLKQSNYKIVYLRQFDLITIVAMRNIDVEGEESVFSK